MKSIKVFLTLTIALVSCKKEETPEPAPENNPVQTYYTLQYITKSGSGAASNGVYWVIDNDTLYLGECYGTYPSGVYYKNFNFAIGTEYNFKILRGIPPSMTSFEIKNEGTIKFIDGNSSTDAYGGASSLIINEGAVWNYSIFYGQCGSINNQIQVVIP